MILSITETNAKHLIETTIANDDNQMIATNLHQHWFTIFGLPDEIYLKKGKVEASKLANGIGRLHKYDNTPKCRSQHQTFNMEMEKQ
jgi:hypothetical protein